MYSNIILLSRQNGVNSHSGNVNFLNNAVFVALLTTSYRNIFSVSQSIQQIIICSIFYKIPIFKIKQNLNYS